MNPFDQFDKPNAGGNPFDQFDARQVERPESTPRLVGQFAQNANDAIANTFGFPVDFVAAGLRAAGVPVTDPVGGSASLKRGIDYVATLPGRAIDAYNQGSLSPFGESRTSRFDPETRGENIAAKMGEWGGTVAATLLPAAAVANAARARAATAGALQQTGLPTQAVANATHLGLSPNVAKMLATQPGTQLASGLAGGAVAGATDDELLGLAAALAVPVAASVGRTMITPTANRLTNAEQQIVQTAQREGVPLTPAQATGSPTLRVLEETMAKMPLSSGPMGDTYRGQREAFTRAVLARAGADATDASPNTLGAIRRSLGTTLDDLAARTTVNADVQFADDVTRVAQDYGRRLDTNVARVFQSYVDDLAPLVQAARSPGANQQISGELYARIRSDIGQSIRGAQNNPALAQALRGLQTALDDAVERSASAVMQQEWRDARRQYQARMTDQQAMSGGTAAERAAGDLPLGAFSRAVRMNDKTGYPLARGQYGEPARLADFLSTRIPESGTVTRGQMANWLTGAGLFGGGFASGGADLPLLAAAAAAATPYAVSRLYNTPWMHAYLTNQLVGPTAFGPLYAAEGLRQGIAHQQNPTDAATGALVRALQGN